MSSNANSHDVDSNDDPNPAGVTPGSGAQPNHDEIERRAYEISLGDDAGDHEDNWLRAEQELLDRPGPRLI